MTDRYDISDEWFEIETSSSRPIKAGRSASLSWRFVILRDCTDARTSVRRCSRGLCPEKKGGSVLYRRRRRCRDTKPRRASIVLVERHNGIALSLWGFAGAARGRWKKLKEDRSPVHRTMEGAGAGMLPLAFLDRQKRGAGGCRIFSAKRVRWHRSRY